MKQDLVLFTNSFPFGQGESFLENEIPFLSNSFNRIVIVSRTNNKTLTRKIPNNAILFRISPTSSIRNKIKLIPYFINNRKRLISKIKEEKLYVQNQYGYPLKKQLVAQIWHDILKALEIKHFFHKTIETSIQEKAILYSYWQNNSALALALIKEEKPYYKCICRIHGGDLYFSRQELKYLTFRDYISKTLDKLFFISEDGYQYQKQLLGKNYKSFGISRLGTIKNFQQNNRTERTKKIIVSCSSIIPVKRVEMIVKSLAQIDSVKIEWLHFGDGAQGIEIEQLAEKLLGEKSNISYSFKGFVNNTEIHKFYSLNKIDLFINVSSSEGIPVSIMEALSYGIPVIATDVGGTREIVEESCGKLIPKDSSPQLIAEAIQEELKQSKSEGAYKKWNSQYNAERNYSEFIKQITFTNEDR